MLSVSRCLIVALTMCMPTLAIAQAAKDPAKIPTTATPAPVSSNPERTTASFADWTTRCDSVGTPTRRICEAAQMITLQGQTNPVAEIAIGKPEPTGGKNVTLVLPTNVALAVKPKISLAKGGAAPLEMTWQRCTPGGCFASAPINDSVLTTLGLETDTGRILFKDAADRDIALPLSFRGLSQAIAALAKEP